MEEITNGDQQAFPLLDPNGNFWTTGLSKREYFAAMAMQGILASRDLQICLLKDLKHDGTTHDNCIAVYAVKQADELLKALEK